MLYQFRQFFKAYPEVDSWAYKLHMWFYDRKMKEECNDDIEEITAGGVLIGYVDCDGRVFLLSDDEFDDDQYNECECDECREFEEDPYGFHSLVID
jgi:hypothetical protein